MATDENSFGMEFDPQQWAELERFLEEIPANVGQNAMAGALRKGGQRIQKSAQSIISSQRVTKTKTRAGRSRVAKAIAQSQGLTGSSLLSKSIKVHVIKKYQPGFFKVMVGVKINAKGSRKTEAYYAHMVEFGHRIVSANGTDTGRRYSGMGYMTTAFNINVEAIKGDLFSSIVTELEKRWKRIPAKSRPQLDFSRLR